MSSSATKSRKQGLDEDSFQRLLAAAFVVQEHIDRTTTTENPATVRPASEDRSDIVVESRPAYAYVMEEIVATQHQIQTRRLELQQAMDLIVERLLPISHADGAAIALLENQGAEIVYRAAVGRSSTIAGRRLKTAEALCSESVRNGTTLQCPDAPADFRLDPKLCKQRGAGGLIAVPVYRDEAVAGALELIFSRPGSFFDPDVRACQLMAGMVTEALDRVADVEFKQALVNERATMLEALEKLKPQLERIVETSAAPISQTGGQASSCSACGAVFGQKDAKCAHCGLPRGSRAGNNSQAKLAAMVRNNGADLTVANSGDSLLKAPSRLNNVPHAQQLDDFKRDPEFEIPSSVIDELEARLREYDPDQRGAVSAASDSVDPEPETRAEAETVAPEEGAAEMPSAVAPEASAEQDSEEIELRITPAPVSVDAWTSAWKTKEWLESVTDPRARTAVARFMRRRKGEIYLGTAVLVVGFAIWWSVWGGGPSWSDLRNPSRTAGSSDGSVPGLRRRVKPPEPDLTMFEKFLVSIGLAEAPPAPVYLGNPDTKVWVDLQTGLYYCPNADLYGNTPRGKFTTQRDAQLDQFEPAYRRACD